MERRIFVVENLRVVIRDYFRAHHGQEESDRTLDVSADSIYSVEGILDKVENIAHKAAFAIRTCNPGVLSSGTRAHQEGA